MGSKSEIYIEWYSFFLVHFKSGEEFSKIFLFLQYFRGVIWPFTNMDCYPDLSGNFTEIFLK